MKNKARLRSCHRPERRRFGNVMQCGVFDGILWQKKDINGKTCTWPYTVAKLIEARRPRGDKLKRPPLSCNLSLRLDCLGPVGSHAHIPSPPFSSLLDPLFTPSSNFHNCPPARATSMISAVLAWKVQFFQSLDENQITGSLAFSQPNPFSNCRITHCDGCKQNWEALQWMYLRTDPMPTQKYFTAKVGKQNVNI